MYQLLMTTHTSRAVRPDAVQAEDEMIGEGEARALFFLTQKCVARIARHSKVTTTAEA